MMHLGLRVVIIYIRMHLGDIRIRMHLSLLEVLVLCVRATTASSRRVYVSYVLK